MSKVLATAARLNHLSMASSRDKESQGAQALERITANKRETNHLLEKKISSSQASETQLIDEQKRENENWFSTGLKNIFGVETKSEALTTQVERSQIAQKHLGMRQDNLQAQAGLITRALQSNQAEIQQLGQDNRKIGGFTQDINPQSQSSTQNAPAKTSQVMTRDKQIKTHAFSLSQESVRIDNEVQMRTIEDQGIQIENIHTAEEKALAEKEEGNFWGNIWESVGATTGALGILAGIGLGIATGGIGLAIGGALLAVGAAISIGGNKMAQTFAAKDAGEQKLLAQTYEMKKAQSKSEFDASITRSQNSLQFQQSIQQEFSKPQ